MDKNLIFIKKAKEIHGDKYDYSKIEYKNNRTKICIICPEHGEFWQIPYSHLRGSGCPQCAIKSTKYKQRLTTEDFIKKAQKIHGDNYVYSKVEYENDKTKVCIICPEHGEFWQTPNNHLKGKGCPSCYGNKKLTIEEFIKKAKEIHGDKYDYSKVEYKNIDYNVCIICPEHGEFWQTPYKHIKRAQGCPVCGKIQKGLSKRLTLTEFIARSKNIHGDNYNYSLAKYQGIDTPVKIICPKHGEFLQTPYIHMKGCGCPSCNSSRLEILVEDYLKHNNIKYVKQKTFKWLHYIKPLHLDFFLPEYNISIECQGVQHFMPIDFAGLGKEWAEESFKRIKERDNVKKQLCEKHNLPLFYVNYDEDYIEKLKMIL